MAVESIDLKIAIEKPSPWGRELTITVPADHVERERAAALTRLAKKVKLPGFRKGKVPAGVIQKRYGAAVEQETIERVIGDAYREALRREKLQPITQANVDRVDYRSGTDLTFHVGFEVRPEVQLERIGGFRVKRETPVVADEHVANVLERLRDQQTLWQPIAEDGTIADGDRIVVEITPMEAEGPGKTRSYQLVLGEGQAAPSIENVIRGMKPGDAGDFTVELADRPDDPASEVKTHTIHVRVMESKRPERPALDDEFAKGVGSFATMDELRNHVRADLEAEATRDADRQAKTRLVQEIVDANPFDVPTSMIDDYLKRIIPDAEDEDAEQLAEARRQVRPGATDAIRRMLVMDRVAETEALRATPAEVDARITDVAERLGRSLADVKARFAKNGRLDELANEITEQKVLDYLTTLSTIE